MAQCIRPINLPSREIAVPCGHCGYCLQNRKQDWQFRIANELKYAFTAYFVTLTYSDEYVPTKNGVDVLDKSDLQKFFKRLRKAHARHSRSQIRYYAVGEYGSQYLRPHYHIIMFNAIGSDIEAAWPLGFIKYEPVNMARIGYVVGYVSSLDNLSVSRGVPKQFSLMSKRPAIGYRYLQTHGKWHTEGLRNYTSINGLKGRLPRYYKKKLFTDYQKEILTEKALQSYDDSFQSLYHHYKNLGHSNPASSIAEQLEYNENLIMENILNSKKKI